MVLVSDNPDSLRAVEWLMWKSSGLNALVKPEVTCSILGVLHTFRIVWIIILNYVNCEYSLLDLINDTK